MIKIGVARYEWEISISLTPHTSKSLNELQCDYK